MKHIFYFLTLFLPILLLSNSSCQKEETPENRGFTAKVDGKKWEAKSPDFKLGPYDAHLTLGDSLLHIIGRNNDSRIDIFLYGNLKNQIIKPGTYILNRDNVINDGSFYNYSQNIIYYTNNNNTGSMTITRIDKEKKLIVGTFMFSAYHATTGKSIKVTDGVFNIPYVNY